MSWNRTAKIAFIGSHGIRKSTAALAFGRTLEQAGLRVAYGPEVVRSSPLAINEAATGESQLWVLVSQVRQELELAPRADVLVLDRGVVDNYAYYLRATGGEDPFSIEPLVRAWSASYDLVVRLLPDLALQADGVRSTSDAFREAIERILDERLAEFVSPDRTITIPASAVSAAFDWWPIAERLAVVVGEALPESSGQDPLPAGLGPARTPAGARAQRATIAGLGSMGEARYAVLATTAPDGSPRPVPICFVIEPGGKTEGQTILWTPLDDKPKAVADPLKLARVRDVLARPRVSVLLHRWSEDWDELAWIRLRGSASLVEPGQPGLREIVASLRDKYPQYRSHGLEDRAMLRIVVDETTVWRASEGSGS
jgi:PPOX class probable F420-dependent enzyme